MNVDSYQVLLNYSFNLLTRKNYSEKEMRMRLARKGKKVNLCDIESAIQRVIDRLKEFNYINDDKILENFFEFRLNARPQGKYFFLNEMRRRGIPVKKAENEWGKRRVNEIDLAKKLLASKRKKYADFDVFTRKKKIATFLAGRGFSPETVWNVLDKIRS